MSNEKILIVDDSQFARKRLQNIFEHAGYEVVGNAENGQQALDLYETLHPDLVTLDYLMSGKNGEQVLKELIQIDPAAKVIMISGSGDNVIRERALMAGATAFIEKFKRKAEFIRTVDRVVSA